MQRYMSVNSLDLLIHNNQQQVLVLQMFNLLISKINKFKQLNPVLKLQIKQHVQLYKILQHKQRDLLM